MKYVMMGTQAYTRICTAAVIAAGGQVSCIISTEDKPDNSYDLRRYAATARIPYHEASTNEDILEIAKMFSPDYIFASWPKKLSNVLVYGYKVIGSHPTLLPYGRGRHPVQWIVSMGLKHTALTFFIMNEGIDSGEVIARIPYSIPEGSTINDVNDIINEMAYRGVRGIVKDIEAGRPLNGTPQNHCAAYYWRKRTVRDTIIDFRMSSDAICRLVRSFTHPYPCAKISIDGRLIPVLEAKTDERETQWHEPGKVLDINDKRIIVKTDDSAVELLCTETLADIDYIYPP